RAASRLRDSVAARVRDAVLRVRGSGVRVGTGYRHHTQPRTHDRAGSHAARVSSARVIGLRVGSTRWNADRLVADGLRDRAARDAASCMDTCRRWSDDAVTRLSADGVLAL